MDKFFNQLTQAANGLTNTLNNTVGNASNLYTTFRNFGRNPEPAPAANPTPANVNPEPPKSAFAEYLSQIDGRLVTVSLVSLSAAAILWAWKKL